MQETKQDFLAEEFEQYREHLLSVAFRMLGSLSDAEDAVQEAWLRLSRSDMSDVRNPGGWLTTVVSRVCLDALRSRKARKEDSLDALEEVGVPVIGPQHRVNAAQEAEMADSVGLAMLVVLDRLNPAERVAFVLHDMFDVSFDDIATIIGKTPAATRQLASRARRGLVIDPETLDADRNRKRQLVDAYLSASRDGDFEALMALLDPDIVFEADAAAVLAGATPGINATAMASNAIKFRARSARLIFINGEPGIVVAPGGRLKLVLVPQIADGKFVRVLGIGDRAALDGMELSVSVGG